MTRNLINWNVVLPILDQLSLIRVYMTMVASSTSDLKWYSNKESRAKIEWRWQMKPSTVKNAIANLTKKGLITADSRGVYSIDKKYLEENIKDNR